jgi:two-component system response regulator FixJ
MAGFQPELFETGSDFLARHEELEPGCVLLDVRMPGVDGMDALEQLMSVGKPWPIIMMTGHGDVPLAVKAIKSGAYDFLEKPFNDQKLVALLHKAFAHLLERSAEAEKRIEAKRKIDGLTKREGDVLQGLVDGLNNKMIARRFDIGLRTIEMHRGNMMTKLDAASLSEALQTAAMAGMKPSPEAVLSEAGSDGT